MQEKRTNAVPIKFTDEDRRILDQLREVLGLGNSQIIRLAIRRLRDQEIDKKK